MMLDGIFVSERIWSVIRSEGEVVLEVKGVRGVRAVREMRWVRRTRKQRVATAVIGRRPMRMPAVEVDGYRCWVEWFCAEWGEGLGSEEVLVKKTENTQDAVNDDGLTDDEFGEIGSKHR